VNGTSKISVLIAEGNDAFREQVVGWLADEPAIEVVESVADAETVVSLARKVRPNVVLIDMHLPGRGGIEATEMITTLLPNTGVIMVAQDGTPDSLRKAMIAGARQFVLKTTTRQELVRTIREVHQTTVARRVLTGPVDAAPATASTVYTSSETPHSGQVIAVFSPKGGVGVTTVAVNTALSLRRDQGRRVCLVDGSLPFGDIAVFLDLVPTHSVIDLIVNPDQIDADYVESALSTHRRSGLKVLLAPPRPEMAEMVSADHLRKALMLLRDLYDFTVIDTWSCLDERVLTVLEVADKILLCFTLDLPAIKSSKVFLEVSELLRFAPEKILPVMIRSTATTGIEVRDVEQTLGKSVWAQVSGDARLASRAINEGAALVLSHATTPLAQDLRHIAESLVDVQTAGAQETPAKVKRAGRFNLFARS
jgi:pilus assembly protein CpaE